MAGANQTRTLLPWRQGFRHQTRSECMGWFAQITLNVGKPSGPRSAFAYAFFHPRCICRCKILAQSPWHNSNVDELFCKRCRTPCISSSYAGSLLSAKGQKTLLIKQIGLVKFWSRFNSHTNRHI